MKFSEFGFDTQLMEGIEASNYEVPTPIQEQAIPHILDGKDVLALAQTGTGKTAAFLLPLINLIITKGSTASGITAMVIVPTRELAIQIGQHLEGLSYFTNISSISVYGGGDGNTFIQEKKALTTGADIVVCTPGKMMAHIKMGYVPLQSLGYLVLDEADRMLDMGFFEDIMFIINRLPPKRQNLLFSATMPDKIKMLAKRILHAPVEIAIAMSKPPEKIRQQAYMVYDEQKIPLIQHLLSEKKYNRVLIFCSSKQSVKQLVKDLRHANIKAGEIHSDLEQNSREEVLMQYRSGRLTVLVATDILGRGIDIDQIDLIINFDVPGDAENFVHRIGRTARAEASGSAFTFITPKDRRKFQAIEKLIAREVDKMLIPEHLGKQPSYNLAAQHSFKKKRSYQRSTGNRHK